MKKFEAGQIVVTTNCLSQVPDFLIKSCLERHLAGDWGDSLDKELNDEGLDPENPDRLMSVYNSEKYPTVWVITEWDRSATTILLPEDY